MTPSKTPRTPRPFRVRRRHVLMGAITLAGLAAAAGTAGAAPTSFHLVTNYGASSVYRFEGATYQRTYTTVPNPADIAISPNGLFAVATTFQGKASVINLTTHQVTDFDYSSDGLGLGNPVFSSDGSYVFLPQRITTSPSILKIHRVALSNLTSQTAQVTGITGCGSPSSAVRSVSGADQLWVSCYTNASLTPVTGLSGSPFTPVAGTAYPLATGSQSTGIALNPSKTTAYISQNTGVVQVDLATGQATSRYTAAGSDTCNAVAVSPADGSVFAACGAFNSPITFVQIPAGSGSAVQRLTNVINIYTLGLPADGSQIWGPSMGLNQAGGTQIATFAVTNPFSGWPLNPVMVTSTPAFSTPRGIAFGIIASAPDAPAAPTASPGDAQATISWSPPQSDGGSPVTGYTVSASPGGGTCTAVAPATTCVVSGLTNGTSYTFTVTATNSVGTSSASAASTSVTPTAPSSPASNPATTPATPGTTPSGATSAPSRSVRLLPSRRSLRAGQAMRLGVRTSNRAATTTAMARMRGQMAVATAKDVRTCVRLPANMVITGAPTGSSRSGRTVCWSSGDIPAGQQRTASLTVRASTVRAVSRTITATARSTGGTQASARATGKATVRITPRAPRPVVTG